MQGIGPVLEELLGNSVCELSAEHQAQQRGRLRKWTEGAVEAVEAGLIWLRRHNDAWFREEVFLVEQNRRGLV